MSRKSYLEQACEAVPEFKTISEKFLRKYTIAGKSESCTRNYLMQISKMVLYFKCSPLRVVYRPDGRIPFHYPAKRKAQHEFIQAPGLRIAYYVFDVQKREALPGPSSGIGQ